MNKKWLGALFLTFFASPAAICAQPWQDVTVVQINREPVRGRVLCFGSVDEARLNELTHSKYLQPLNGEWRMKSFSAAIDETAEIASASGWSNVTIPQAKPMESAVTIYQREYKYPFSWIDRQLFIRVGYVNSPYSVYINGEFCGYNQSGRTPAEFDITKLSKEDNNTVSIVAYGNSPLKALESPGRKETQLAGEIYVMAQPKVRMRDYTALTTIAGTYGNLEMGFIVKSQLLNPKEVTIHFELYSPEGELVTRERRDARFEMKLEDTVRFFAHVPNVKAWTHETPNLYTIVARTQREGRFTEYTSFKVGFRLAAIGDGCFTINGYDVPLTVAEFTPSWNASEDEHKLLALKQAGVNCVKVAHHPADDSFYSVCDRIGLYVCDQADIDTNRSGKSIAKGGNPSNDPIFENAVTDRVLSMYHASKTHPSAVLFSIADNSTNGYNLYESYLALRRLEPYRPIVYLGAGGEWNSDAAVNGSFGRIKFDTGSYKKGSPVPAFSSQALGGNEFLVTSNLHATEVYKLHYTVRNGAKTITSGVIDTEIAPQESVTVKIPVSKMKPKYTVEFSTR